MNKAQKFLSWCYGLIRGWMMIFSLPRIIRETKDSQTPVRFEHWLNQKILGNNREVYWPIHPDSIVRGIRNIFAGTEVSPGYEKGCYIQAINPIYVGNYTQIASNVGIISANHDLHDLRIQIPGKPVKIGQYCWLGMGTIILPEVELGDFTIVGAGSIVTKSFPGGYCVIAGNPAKVIKLLDQSECVQYKRRNTYYGFYKEGYEFNNYRKKYLNI